VTFKEDVHREKNDSQNMDTHTMVKSPEDRLSSYTYSVGLEDEIRVLDPLAITVGCSYDAFEKREREQYTWNGSSKTFIKNTGDTGDNIHVFNPMIGFSYDYSPALNVFGSIARKVRFPTMRNLYATGVIGPQGDPDLTEERSTNYEVGSRYSFAQKYMLETSVFYSDVKNMINFDNQIGRFEQYDKATLEGLEIGLSGQLTAELYGKISYTYLRARTNSTVTIKNTKAPDFVYEPDELPYRPEHKIDLELSQKFSFGTAIDFNGSYVSESTYYDHADPAHNQTLVAHKETLDNYFLCNLKISQNLGHGLQVYVAADNLFNENYQDIFQLPTAGRTVWAGIKIDL
jgi:outer membrane receptor protein involved in Fe transport